MTWATAEGGTMGLGDGIDRLVRNLLQTNGHASAQEARPSTALDAAAPTADEPATVDLPGAEPSRAWPAPAALPDEQESDEPDDLPDPPPASTDTPDSPDAEIGPDPLPTGEAETPAEDAEPAPLDNGSVMTGPAPTAELAVPDSAESAALAPLGGHDPAALERLETTTTTVEALGLGYHLGVAVERIALGASAGSDGVQALREATWLIERYIALVEQRPVGADLHASSLRLARTGEAIAELRALAAALDAPGNAVSPAPVERPVSLADEAVPPAEGAAAAETSPEDDPPVVITPVVESTPTAEPPGAEPTSSEARPEPFGREVALMAIRWTIMVVAVIVVVLAVTLIGEWR